MAKKVLGNSVTEFSILELSGAKNPGIFCPLKKKILEFSRIFFLKFHEKLVFPEFSGPRIFHPAIFCLEIFCPGILFPGKFWHSGAHSYKTSSPQGGGGSQGSNLKFGYPGDCWT